MSDTTPTPQGRQIDTEGSHSRLSPLQAVICDHMGGDPNQIVTRIAWRYLEDES